MLRRRGPVLAGAIVAVALLGACSGSDGGSTANPPTTASTAPAAAPSTPTTTTAPDATEPTAPVDDFSTRDPFQPQG
jgi:ABC-type glycerol-3-phosphate transport system substrate-binding protein